MKPRYRLTALLFSVVFALTSVQFCSFAEEASTETEQPVEVTSTTAATTEKAEKTTKKTAEKILCLLRENPSLTNKELAEQCGITEDGVYYQTKKMKSKGLLRRIGGDKGGHWEIVKK